MKKLITVIAALALILSVGTAAYAAKPAKAAKKTNASTTCVSQTKSAARSASRTCSQTCSRSQNYVDANNDGVCDNRPADRPANCSGQGQKQHNGGQHNQKNNCRK